MATLRISPPDDLIAFVESEMSSGNHTNQDEYFRDMIEFHRLEGRRLSELRAAIELGIEQADRAELVEYDSVEDCVNHTVIAGKKLLEERRAAKL